MVEKLTREMIAEQAIVHSVPPACVRNAPTDRTFELPTALYGTTVGMFFAFLAVMAVGFSSPGLIIPLTICAVFFLMFFGVPAIWTGLAPDNPVAPLSWQRFRRDGVRTVSGHNTAREATIQVLILPTLILVWGVAVTTIAAVVG